jgi:hypothetical protein
MGESAKRFPTRAAIQTKRGKRRAARAGGKNPANLARPNLIGIASRVRLVLTEEGSLH